MIHDLVSARHIDGYRIELTFDNGKTGSVDFSHYLDNGGVFERLRDFNYFLGFRVNKELGVLAWDDELDIAPETLYAEATNEPLPEWMTADQS